MLLKLTCPPLVSEILDPVKVRAKSVHELTEFRSMLVSRFG